MLILAWLGEGYDRLIAVAARQLCPMAQLASPDGYRAGTTVPAGTMFLPTMWRRTLDEPERLFWRCRVCLENVSEVARIALDPRVEEHRIDHCEEWLSFHNYVVPGRYAHRDVLADALSAAFETIGRRSF